MKRLIAALTICFCFVGNAHSTIMFHDDFASGKNAGEIKNNVFLPKWTINAGNIDLWNFAGFSGRSVDLGGTRANATIRSASAFTFLESVKYEISFLLGNNKHLSTDNGLHWGLWFNGAMIKDFSITDLSMLSATKTQSVTYTFTPRKTFDAKLFFTATGFVDNGGAIIDDVMIKSVPAPGTLALFCVALFAMRRYSKR